MAISSSFPTFISFMALLSTCLLFSWLPDKTHAYRQGNDFKSFHISSLFPDDSVCKPSTSSKKGPSTMEIFHRYGACAALSRGRTDRAPPLTETLSYDQSRVRSIQARIARHANANQVGDNKANLPAQSGNSLQLGNYLVRVGLGSPKQTVSLAFDTGSDLTWTQCQPCTSCYQQQDPIFNPSKSSSYSDIACNSRQCSELASSSSVTPPCAGTTCTYSVGYGDQSTTSGSYAQETLTLTPTDVFPNFQFGCGQNNQGLFGKSAGILGLGRSSESIISQTEQKYNRYFSYCLPSTPNSVGHLTFGTSAASTFTKFTPFGDNVQDTSFYYVDIVRITVGGQQVSIEQSVFMNSGTIIDSGTVITRLPPTVYRAVSTAFQQQMTNYRQVQRISILDTCYDFSSFGNSSITIPKIIFTFAGDVKVDVHVSGILLATGDGTACLAFAANDNESDVGIFGNTQQKTFDVVYDVAGGKLGFGAGGCN